MDTKDKLIEKLKEYIEFLSKEIGDNAMFLHLHHIDTSLETVNTGKAYREQIADLEKQVKEQELNPEINEDAEGPILDAMEDYHKSRLKEIMPTDKEIEKWAKGTITDDLSDIKTKFDVEFIKRCIVKAKMAGAEFMRDHPEQFKTK